MHRKAQGSLEYLLILAAILAIAVVVVVVANSMLAAPQGEKEIGQDKYNAALAGVELIGYTKLYDGTGATAPQSIKYKGLTFQKSDGTSNDDNAYFYGYDVDADVATCDPTVCVGVTKLFEAGSEGYQVIYYDYVYDDAGTIITEHIMVWDVKDPVDTYQWPTW